MEQLDLHRLVLQRLRRLAALEQERLYVEQSKARLAKLPVKLPTAAPTKTSIPVRVPTTYHDDRRRTITTLGITASERELIPIKLDIDTDGYKLRDTFIWNINEQGLTMEEFASITCRDFDLPPAIIAPLIVKSIQTQVDENREAASLIRNAGGIESLIGIRALIKLDITVGFLQLNDQFEWDLGDTTTDIESFSKHYCTELALAPEFETAIVCDVMEQLNHLRRAMLLAGFTRDETTGAVKVSDPDLQPLLLPPIKNIRRDPNSLNDFSPLLTEIDPLELERIELSRDREARRKRRQVRGRRAESWTVEVPKTIRTPLSYRGSLHRVMSKLEDDETSETGARSGSGRARRSRR